MSARGRAPRVTSRAVTWLPRKPAAPVMRTVIIFPIFVILPIVILRQAPRASQGQAHRTQARQPATRHEDSGPRVREQEHRAHSGATDPEYARENQQSDKFVASNLPGWRRQDERQVEQGVSVEHDQDGDGYSHGSERQQAEERVE